VTTQKKSVVGHSLTSCYWLWAALALLLLNIGARPARALALQLNTNAPFTCAAVEGGNAANGTPASGGFDQQWNYLEGQLIGGVGSNMPGCRG